MFKLHPASPILALLVSVSGQMHNLTTTEFDQVLGAEDGKTNALWFIMFHVSWCGHCKHTLPIINMVSKEPIDTDLETMMIKHSGVEKEKEEESKKTKKGSKKKVEYRQINFAAVDCTDDKSLVNRFGFSGYPSIVFFDEGVELKKGGFREFHGSRSPQGILHYAQRMARKPEIRQIEKWAELEEDMKRETMVSYLHVGSSIPSFFASSASAKRDKHAFFYAETNSIDTSKSSSSSISKVDLSQPGTYVLASDAMAGKWEVRKFDESEIILPKESDETTDKDSDYSEDPTVRAFKIWTADNKFPGVWEAGFHNFFDLTHAKKPLTVVTYDSRIPREDVDTTSGNFKKSEGATISTESQYKSSSPKPTFFPVEVLREKMLTAFQSGDPSNLKQGGFFAVVDLARWSETLEHFQILASEGNRVWIVTDDFMTWREDKDYLTFEKTLDLANKAKLSKGYGIKKAEKANLKFVDTTQALIDYCDSQFPFIQLQGKSFFRKRITDFRMVYRWGVALLDYAERGVFEACVAFLLIFVITGVLYFLLYLAWQILCSLYDAFTSPEGLDRDSRVTAVEREGKKSQ